MSQVPGNVRPSKQQTEGLRRGTQSPAKSNREGLFKLFSIYVELVRRQREVGWQTDRWTDVPQLLAGQVTVTAAGRAEETSQTAAS